MNSRRILFIANGHGEDVIASGIQRRLLADAPDVETLAFPLVGDGKIYRQFGLPCVPAADDSPRHGFGSALPVILRSILRGNFLFITPQQRVQAEVLRREGAALIVAVGDVLPVLLARWMKVPFIFIGCNKTDYYPEWGRRYLIHEVALLRRAITIYARDSLTAQNLRRRGLTQSRCAGNPMVDDAPEAKPPRKPGEVAKVCLLPGSYDDAPLNLEDLLDFAAAMNAARRQDERIEFAVAAPAWFDAPAAQARPVPGWQFTNHSSIADASGEWRQGDLVIPLFNGKFWELVSTCDLVAGLTGTANEQSAGLGRPIVSFPTRGAQYTRAFGRSQQHLLGGALAFIEAGPSAAAAKGLEILRSPELAARMGAAGRERVERGQAAKDIVAEILRLVGERAPATRTPTLVQ